MPHQVQNVDFHAGDDEIIGVHVTVDGTPTGAAVDLTGASITWILQRSITDASPVLTRSTGGGGVTITAPTNGDFEIALTDVETDPLSGGYYHRATVTDAGGDVSSVVEGVATVSPKPGTTWGGVVGTDTYASVADADLYWSLRNNLTWMQAAALDKSAALREATLFLDGRYDWIGDHPGSSQQRLGWPRNNAVDHEDRDVTGIPLQVRDATSEAASLALAGNLVPADDRGGQIERAKIGPLEVKYSDHAPTTRSFEFIDMLLRGFTTSRRGASEVRLKRA